LLGIPVPQFNPLQRAFGNGGVPFLIHSGSRGPGTRQFDECDSCMQPSTELPGQCGVQWGDCGGSDGVHLSSRRMLAPESWGTSKTAQQVKALAIKPDDLSSVSGTYLEGVNQLLSDANLAIAGLAEGRMASSSRDSPDGDLQHQHQLQAALQIPSLKTPQRRNMTEGPGPCPDKDLSRFSLVDPATHTVSPHHRGYEAYFYGDTVTLTTSVKTLELKSYKVSERPLVAAYGNAMTHGNGSESYSLSCEACHLDQALETASPDGSPS
ncbi:hypothetical protein STEG23_007825, partial [Scotinomys teguina]